MTEKGSNQLKTGSFQLFVHPKWSKINFGKEGFGPIFDPFLVHFQKKISFSIFKKKPILGFLEHQNRPQQAQNGLTPLVLASHIVEDQF